MSKVPAKRKNNEKRKEKSRVAARFRRNKEQHIFQDLTDALPVSKEEVEKLDKASLMRIAIAYLRVRDVVDTLPELHTEESASDKMCALKAQESYLQALDGFVMVISQLGDVVYCSENVAEHLGISQLELMGQSIMEFSHPCDHEELRDVLRPRTEPPRLPASRPATFPLRLKCALTGKGRNVHFKSSYKVIQFTGHVVTPADEKILKCDIKGDGISKSDGDKISNGGSLIAVGRPIPHPANIEIPLDNKTFLTKHSLDMKFTYTDEVLHQWLGFAADDLVGQSLYEYQHTTDVATLASHFKTLFSKGQCETGRYRFLAKCGGYAWVQTQATLITDKHQRPVSVVCVNYLISGIECKDEVFSANQMRHAELTPAPQAAPALVTIPVEPKPVGVPQNCRATKASVPNGTVVEEIPQGATVSIVSAEEARPRPATAQIFAPRTKDMNKGYLMFSEDDPGLTMLKEEPEDLTHLAPTAGDACIPLEDSPFDMFDEFILNDNYCSLLGDDLATGSPVDSLGADSLLLSSPEPQESESSCEQSSLLTELSLDGLDGGRSEGELDGRAPYIPMSGSDELPLLTPAVMWGALPDSVSLARPAPPLASEPAMAQLCVPSLQRLLAAPPHTGPPPQDIITNIYADQGLIPDGSVTTWDTGVKRTRSDADDSSAKRSKRTLPAVHPMQQEPSPTSSVLMNLLDHPGPPVQRYRKIVNSTQSFLPQNFQYNALPIQNNQENQPIFRAIQIPSPGSAVPSPLSPLTLNVGCPLFINPRSPRIDQLSPYPTSPSFVDIAPAVYSRITGKSLLSPGRFNPRSMAPGDVLQTGRDPFLPNKMLSPNAFPMEAGTGVLERDKLGLESVSVWIDPGDMYQGDESLLAVFDDQ